MDLQAEAVVLDFVDPAVGDRRTLGAARQAGIDEGGRRKRGTLAGYAITPRDHGGNIIQPCGLGSPALVRIAS